MTNTIEYKPLEKKFIELLQCADHKTPLELVQLRISKLGFGNTCSKCNGTGQYAHYGVCFSCRGNGRFKERLTKALYAELEAAVQDGALERYFEALQRKARLEKADKVLFALMNQNELSGDYTTAHDLKRKGTINEAAFDLLYMLRHEQTETYKIYTDKQVEITKKAFKQRWKERLEKIGAEFAEAEFEDIKHEMLDGTYAEVKGKLEKINERYSALKAAFKNGLL
jgi:hypothetical protein